MNKENNWFIMIFLCFIMLIINRTVYPDWMVMDARMNANNWFGIRKEGIISCGSKGLIVNDIQFFQAIKNDEQPTNKNNGNSCSHQQGVGALCDLAGTKRRCIKITTC